MAPVWHCSLEELFDEEVRIGLLTVGAFKPFRNAPTARVSVDSAVFRVAIPTCCWCLTCHPDGRETHSPLLLTVPLNVLLASAPLACARAAASNFLNFRYSSISEGVIFVMSVWTNRGCHVVFSIGVFSYERTIR